MWTRGIERKEVGKILLVVYDAFLVCEAEVGGAAGAVVFEICVGEGFVGIEGDAGYSGVICGRCGKEQRVSGGWYHLFCVDVVCGLELVMDGDGSWAGGGLPVGGGG